MRVFMIIQVEPELFDVRAKLKKGSEWKSMELHLVLLSHKWLVDVEPYDHLCRCKNLCVISSHTVNE